MAKVGNKKRPSNDDLDSSLYAKREKIFPREVHGVYAFWRTSGIAALLGIYYGLPWFQWKGRQAVLLDLPERKFYIFDLIFWPQDFFYFAVILILAALSLFFFTALAGRLWCGYACPQTVWTEVFLWIERKIEGNRLKQMQLDQADMSYNKLFLKASKHTVWILLSAFTGFTFVGYFTPIAGVADKILALTLGPWESFWIIFYSFATYGNAGWLREQVCIYMCPYARFQSAMFDNNTLIISYDSARGEPRGSRKKTDNARSKGLGDCIDCTMCVQVCPTGIDIRDGLQYQCIACAACIDVCNEVMDKMGYAKKLIKYTTENAISGKPARILRPRVIIYGLLLISIFSTLIYAISQRIPLELDVIRDRNALYRQNLDGLVENIYTLKIINMDDKKHTYKLKVEGINDLRLQMNMQEIRVAAGEVTELPVWIRVDPIDIPRRSTKITFTLTDVDNTKLMVQEDARFLGPTRSGAR